MAQPLRKPKNVSRIFFQEILEGDRRKLEALSNDAPSGGGARDLRVPDPAFGDLFRKMFPDTETVRRRRDGDRVDVAIHVGRVFWMNDDGEEQSWPIQYEPPTTARPREGRIARIHEVPALADRVPSPDAGRTYLLLVQEDNGKVYPHYITKEDLDDPAFNREIASAIRQCSAATSESRSVRGFVDYVSETVYCHG